jgi:peptide/nickel transport system permease protein
MVAEGAQHFDSWWIATSAGVAIFSVALAVNLIGDTLRDSMDPWSRRAIGETRDGAGEAR